MIESNQEGAWVPCYGNDDLETIVEIYLKMLEKENLPIRNELYRLRKL